jgi:hypothetical protein
MGGWRLLLLWFLSDLLQINSSLSPYEGEQDDYEHFAAKVKDDLFIPSRRIDSSANEGRQRGMSESGSLSRPPSSAAQNSSK